MNHKLKLFALLYIISFTVNAQEWELFKENDKYNYLNMLDSTIYTIWIDSVILSSEPEYYFNKAAKYEKVYSQENQDSIYVGVYKPNYLFNHVITKVNDSLNYLGYNKDWLIKPFAEAGEQWPFSVGISATIANMSVETVLNQADSVKTIELSDGQIIKLSKSFGIIYWRISDEIELGLIGVDEKIGISIPKFNNYFNYNIGDIFQYRIKEGFEDDPVLYEYDIKYSIEEKNLVEDSINYNLKGIQRKTVTDFDGYSIIAQEYSLFTKESAVYNYADHFINKYHNELVSLENTNLNFYPEGSIYLYSDEPLNYTLNIKLNKEGEVVKSFKTENNRYGPINIFELNMQDSILSKSRYDAQYFDKLTFLLKPAIGIDYYILNSFAYGISIEFIGAVLNGDTLGVVNNDAYFMVSTKESNSDFTSIYPNPFSNEISINIMEPGVLEVIDMNGFVLYRNNHEKGLKIINLGNLQSGIYFIRLVTSNHIYNSRIIKQ